MASKNSSAASDSLELLVTLNCSSDGTTETKKLTLSPIPKLVTAVKTSIETEFNIPRCLQCMSLNDQVLTDSQEIANLYIRNKDLLSVTYLAKANVESIKKLVSSFLHPLTVLLGTNPNLLNKTDEETKELMDHSLSGLIHMTYSDLLPWQSPVVEANRQFFIQEGGVNHTVELLSLLNQPPWDFSRWHHKLLRLEISCLSLLWNFAETGYSRRMVVDRGGWDVMMRSLLHYPRDQFLKTYTMHGIFDAAVGCISNYSELESCQLPLVQNKPAMDLLLTFAIQGPSLNIFTKMLIANCLFRLTHSHDTHSHLANMEVLGPVLEFCDLYQGNPNYGPNIAMRYMICLALARVLLFSYDTVPSQYRPKILQSMDQLLAVAKAPQIASLEEKYQYNWITVFPFLETLYAPLMDCVKRKTYSLDSDDPVKEKCQHWSMSIAVLSMESEMSRECNRQLLRSQRLLDYVVCLPWEMPGQWKERCSSVVNHFAKNGRLPVPRLSSIAKAKLARSEYYGNQYCKLMLTLAVIIGVSVVFTILEGLMELQYKGKIACSSFEFFTHGGMIFLFATSTLFAAVYLMIFMLYLLSFHYQWGLPTKKSFYRYALFLSLVNTVQAIGSMLWYTAKSQHPHQGNAGICLTIITTVIYVGTFAPVVYWIFLKNYFRMNKSVRGPGRINTSAQDSSLTKKRFVPTSRPILVKKRSLFEDQTSLTADSFSSTSSYGSLNDEEIFTRHPES